MTDQPLLPDILVMVADHSIHVRRILRDVLIRSGIKRLLEASDGAEALEMFTSAVPDIMIVDWDLPMLSGEEFARLVRSTATSPAPKSALLMMLGQPQKRIVDRAIRSGVTDILLKPFSPKALCQRIDAILHNPTHFVQTETGFRSLARMPSESARLVTPARLAQAPSPPAPAKSSPPVAQAAR